MYRSVVLQRCGAARGPAGLVGPLDGSLEFLQTGATVTCFPHWDLEKFQLRFSSQPKSRSLKSIKMANRDSKCFFQEEDRG